MKKTQNQLVYDHLLDHGYITQVVATSYGVRRLASRIHDLKKIGVVNVEVETRSDDLGVRYAYYSLPGEDRAYEKASRARGGTWNVYKE